MVGGEASPATPTYAANAGSRTSTSSWKHAYAAHDAWWVSTSRSIPHASWYAYVSTTSICCAARSSTAPSTLSFSSSIAIEGQRQ